MPGATAWLYAPLPNSGVEECDNYRHLKYIKASVDKEQVSKN